MVTKKRLTPKALAEATGLSVATIRLYCDAKLIPAAVDTNGHRSFPLGAVEIAKAVHAQRMARAGRPVGNQGVA
jgi:DNA-binding transcriptional MerR regulator